jgi:hypothetical protein
MIPELYERHNQLVKKASACNSNFECLLDCYQEYLDLSEDILHVSSILAHLSSDDGHQVVSNHSEMLKQIRTTSNELRMFAEVRMIKGLGDFFYNLGWVFLRAGEENCAFQVWEKLLSVYPDHPDVKRALERITE